MHAAVVVFGAIVVLGALIGFVRSLWRPASGEGNRGYGVIPGETQSDGGGHHGGGDAGGHSG
jgi:hypothetical protein